MFMIALMLLMKIFNIKKLSYKYKLIFLDPPYNEGLLNPAIEFICDLKLLKKCIFSL